jgi:hypothetical protein
MSDMDCNRSMGFVISRKATPLVATSGPAASRPVIRASLCPCTLGTLVIGAHRRFRTYSSLLDTASRSLLAMRTFGSILRCWRPELCSYSKQSCASTRAN